MRGKLGPRDDIESLIYLLLYLQFGKLPWQQNLPVMSDDIMDHMELQRIVRQVRDPEVLIGGQGAEPELIKLLGYLQ